MWLEMMRLGYIYRLQQKKIDILQKRIRKKRGIKDLKGQFRGNEENFSKSFNVIFGFSYNENLK